LEDQSYTTISKHEEKKEDKNKNKNKDKDNKKDKNVSKENTKNKEKKEESNLDFGNLFDEEKVISNYEQQKIKQKEKEKEKDTKIKVNIKTDRIYTFDPKFYFNLWKKLTNGLRRKIIKLVLYKTIMEKAYDSIKFSENKSKEATLEEKLVFLDLFKQFKGKKYLFDVVFKKPKKQEKVEEVKKPETKKKRRNKTSEKRRG